MASDDFLEFSDEEVLPVSPSIDDSGSSEDDDYAEFPRQNKSTGPLIFDQGVHPGSESDASRAPSEDGDEDIGGWGTSKKDYYDADVIETEADALEEEAEARRLQQKHLQGMTEADFGFDEADWLDSAKDTEPQWDQKHQGDEPKGVVSETLPQQEITDNMDSNERLEILRVRYPEFEPLAKEFLDLQYLHADLGLAAATAMALHKSSHWDEEGSETPPIAVIKHSALSAYLAALSMYFAVFTSAKPAPDGKAVSMSPNELRDHPIMDSLVQLRELWGKVKDVPIPEIATVEVARLESQEMAREQMLNHQGEMNGLSTKPKSRKRKSKAERAAARAQEEANARRLESLRKTEASLASLPDLTKIAAKPAKLASRAAGKEDDSDFGDPKYLATHEAAQKEARKKSLKFYTSQIASKSQKRGAAGRDAGGDADLPYKERLRDRQARLNAQAEKRGKNNKPNKDEALGGASDEEDATAAREIRDAGEEDYYNLVANKSSAKKAEKARIAAEQAAAASGLVRIAEEELDGEDGKRAISYAIEKNKGLHGKRKKEVRNPRVKKRKKFEEKKKRLGSVRQVYKGGEGKGYQGELTGIKGNLVRSVKL